MENKIDPNNIGYKLLKSMGWKEGKSLGKTNKGILEPIKIDLESKICKEANKNYKGKSKKNKNGLSKTNFTLSSFKSKLYNTKEEKDLQKNIQNEIKENDKLINVNKANHQNLFKEKNYEQEKKIKKNILILINLLYNKYFIDNENEYVFLKHRIQVERASYDPNKNSKYNNFTFDETVDFEMDGYPMNYNLKKLIEITDNIEKLFKFEPWNRKNLIFDNKSNEEFINQFDISLNSSNLTHNNINIDLKNYVANIMFAFLLLEDFIQNKNFKALTEEILYYKNSNISSATNIQETPFNLSMKYFEYIDKLDSMLDQIIMKKFFYCSACSINFDNFEELENHLNYDCGEQLSE